MRLHDENASNFDRIETVDAVLSYLTDTLCWIRANDDTLSEGGATGLLYILMSCQETLRAVNLPDAT